MFDNLSYKYQTQNGHPVSNRLYHVNDGRFSSGIMPDDIDDQGTYDSTTATINSVNNYGYDEIGNLQRDSAEGIQHIEWTAYGKIKSITRRSDYTKIINLQTVYPSNLEFRYDATGNRIAKIEKPRDAGGEKSSAYWITTYYVRDATGNPMATYKEAPPSAEEASYKLIERPIYGSSRLGIDNTQLELIGYTAPTSGITTYELGLKQYELVNHLGNVLSTVSDKKIPHTTNGTDIDYYLADITSATDYYPFGSPMSGRTFSSEKYRFGFNGKEKDDELKGAGGQYDYGFRIYDSRLGRFLSVDPLTNKYPMLTPYQFASNSAIQNIDLDGLEGVQYFVTAKVLGVEIAIKKVVEIDVYVAIGTDQHKIEDVEGIKNDYNQQYNNNFVDNTLGYSVPVEFVFNMKTFDSDKIAPRAFADELKDQTKRPDNFEKGLFETKHPRGIVLCLGDPIGVQGTTNASLITISRTAKNPKHTRAHEMGHAFLDESRLGPRNDIEHNILGGIFGYGKDSSLGYELEKTEDVNQDNIDLFMKGIPQIENKESDEIKTFEQEKGL